MLMQEDLFNPLETHKLKPLLEQNNIRQSQAANKLGITVHYLNNILNGHIKPSKRLAEAISDLVTKMGPQ
jgi:transcriptional regulator with XRE-family HTH domain